MSKLASKLNKRIMATVLSVAMVMSNMTVYASEVTDPQVDKIVDEVAVDAEDTSVTPGDAATSGDELSSDETAAENADEVTDASGQTTNTGGDEVTEPENNKGTDDASLENEEGVKDEGEIGTVDLLNVEDEVEPNYVYNTANKIDVWDFGAADLGITVNNMLTAETINTKLFDSENGNAIKSFAIDKDGAAVTTGNKDFGVEVGTGSALHSKNDALTYATTMTDSIALAEAADNEDSYDSTIATAGYTGYLNLGTYADGTNEVYLDVQADKGDKITVVAVAQEATTINYVLLDGTGAIPGDATPATVSVGAASATEKAAYVFDFTADDADETDGGIYRIYSEDGDLAIARVYRDSDTDVDEDVAVKVSGSVTFPDDVEEPDVTGLNLVFTDAEDEDAAVVTVAIEEKEAAGGEGESTYEYTVDNADGEDAYLYENHTYTVSVSGDDYVVAKSTNELDLTTGVTNGEKTFPVVLESATSEDTITLSGSISFTDDKGAALPTADETAAFAGLGKITFQSTDENATAADNKEATITNKSYTVTLDKAVVYKMVVENSASKYKSVKIDGITNTDAIDLSTATADIDDANITIALKEKKDDPSYGTKDATFVLDIGEEYTYTEQTNLTAGGYLEDCGTNKFFSIYYKAGEGTPSRIEIDAKTFTDDDGNEYTSKRNINLQAGVDVNTPAAAIKFETIAAAKVKVYWRSGSNSARTVAIYDKLGNKVDNGDDVTEATNVHIDTLEVSEAGTYYLGGTNGIRIYRVEVDTKVSVRYVEKSYTLDIGEEYTYTEQTNLTAGGYLEDCGTDKFFSIYYKAGDGTPSRIEIDAKTFTDDDGNEYTSKRNINLQAGVDVNTPAAAIKFDTIAAAKVKVYWRSGSNSARTVAIYDKLGNKVDNGDDVTEATNVHIDTLEVSEAGTYYLGGTNGIRIYRVEVDTKAAVEYEEKDLILDIGEEYTYTEQTNLTAGGYLEDCGTNKFFSIYYKAGDGTPSRIEIDAKTFTDDDGNEYTSKRNINLQAGVDVNTPAAAIKFDTIAAAKVKVYWRSGSNSARTVAIYDKLGNKVDNGDDVTEATNVHIDTLEVSEAGTYYLGGTNGIRIYRVEVTTEVLKSDAADEEEEITWDKVSNPVITDAAVDGSEIKVSVTANVVNKNYSLVVKMYDEANNELGQQRDDGRGTEHEVKFGMAATGTYKFKAILSYKEFEKDEEGNDTEEVKLEDSKESELYPADGIYFLLPLAAPGIRSITDKGVDSETNLPKVELAWDAVPEATSYLVKVTEKGATATTTDDQPYVYDADTTAVILSDGLEVDKTYIFSVAAKRAGTGADGADEYSEYTSEEHEVTSENNTTWAFAVYGPSAKASNNNYSTADVTNTYPTSGGTPKPINAEAGDEVRVWSLGQSSGGKIQPTSIDGLAFYYTTVNPATTNFVLSATAYVNEWTYNNGQEGFGVMAADRVLTLSEDNDVWNNSYQAVVSKVIYRWDAENNVAAYDDDLEKSRYEMQIGIGSTEKKGVTAENLSEFAANSSAAQNKYFKANSKSLETSLGEAGLVAGTYNIIGNYTGNAPKGTQEKYLLTQMRLTVELNNTGYFVSYTPVDQQTGEPIESKKYTIKYYDRDALSQIDKNNVYVGLFASRNADISFRDISFTTSDPATDPPPEEQPTITVIPSYGITSGSTVNHSEYEMLFAANWPGWLTIKDGKGDVIVDNDKIIPDEQGTINTYKVKDPVLMNVGVNTFQWTYTPDEAYNPEDPASYYKQNMGIEDGSTGESEEITQYTFLSDYSAQTDSFTVTYKAYGEEGDALYVSPTGSALGTGTKANPLDIYTAVKYAQPGQTIYLMKGKDGVYNLARTVTIDRGINGTVDADGNINYIKMMPAPDAGGARSIVLDFGRSCEGIVLAGDYWYLYGFDVTKSAYGSDGMRVCGSHNVVDSVYTYNNGNTGIQISRYRSLDRNFWPSYNTILNCTSYLNADQGFEDADGFAAKLTIGEGNVFDGCISAYNADDGWDLYAKTDTGSIGSVVIKNSIAYKNGYVLIEDPNDDGKITYAEATSLARVLSLDGIETPAGNGNGFKMGGSSVPSTGNGHQLISSIAFRNRAKGIDSNSGPNIKATNSVSFNNESYNVAFYTNSAPETDFAAQGVISFRTADLFDEWDTPDGTNPEVIGQKPYTEAAGERMIFKGAQVTNESAVKNDTNYYWDLDKKQSLNSKGETVDSSWFVSVDYKAFEAEMKKDIVDYPRNENGSINMHGFLVLADESKRNDYFGGTTSPDAYETIAPPTSGDVSSGDATGETESGVRPEDMAKYTELLTQNSTGARLGLWFNVVDAENVYYTGKAVKPVVHVYEGTTLLTNKDYTITYRNNINACVVDKEYAHYADYTSVPDNKKPSIIVRGKGNYVGLASTQYYSIRPVELSDDLYVAARDIAVSSTSGRPQKINPVVTFNGRRLSSRKDFEFGVEVQTTEERPKVDAEGNPVLGEDGQQETETVVTGTSVDKNKTTASEDCKVVISAVAGGNFAGETKIDFRVISDKSKLASSFKVDRIPEQERLGYEDYEETKPIRVEPELVVKNKQNTPLTLAKVNEETGELEGDYTVIYRNNVEVGMATAIITGVNDYAGTKEVKFRIVAPRINTLMMGREQSLKIYATQTVSGESVTDPSKEFEFRNLEYDYTGSAIRIRGLGVSRKRTVTTTDPDTGEVKTSEQWIPLEVDKDYTITYKNNNRAGRASVTIKGKGNYTGAITKTFKINALDLNNPGNNVIGGTFASDYELKASFEKGSAKPEVILLVNGNKMQIGKDYTVTYRSNTSVSSNNPNRQPSVVLRGRGGLKGTLTKTFTITRKSLSDADVTITADDVKISKRTTVSGNNARAASSAYTGSLASRIIIKDANGRPLTAGVDYDKDSITYELISGNGSISGKGTVKSDGTVDTSNKRPTATINSDSDVLTIRATVKAFDSSNARKYARCNYADSISVTYRVGYARTSIMSARVVVNYNNGRLKYFNYTGEQIRLNQSGVTTDLTVTVNGQTLKYNEDFEIVTKPVDSYVNNIKKGTASLTIRGIGKYTGTKVVRFRIGAKPFEWWTIPSQNGDSNGGSGSSSSQPAMLSKDLELDVL